MRENIDRALLKNVLDIFVATRVANCFVVMNSILKEQMFSKPSYWILEDLSLIFTKLVVMR